MPLPHETQQAVGMNFERCDSRSLVLERFSDPVRKKDDRKNFFRDAIKKAALAHKRNAWSHFLLTSLGLKPEDLLFGKLQARLIINMAGGVMENAGLCLDRLTGIPYIPGSAVKGCARRFAIQALLEAPADQKAALLAEVALVFGWSDLEWHVKSDFRPKRNETDEDFQERWEKERSDFAFACGDNLWDKTSDDTMVGLAGCLNLPVKRDKRGRVELPGYTGDAQFLPAYPVGSPPTPDLELDVVTCHHKEYYAGNMPVALDTEDPVPVVFPAVAPGHVFVFAVLGKDLALTGKAKSWLQDGLQQFGLGAKTAAGYGWFEVEQATADARQELQATIQQREAALKRQQLQADPKILDELKTKKEDQLRGIINQFQFEEKLWPKDKNEVFQLSLLIFCTESDSALFRKEKANPKSKIVKALQNLASKFNRALP